MLTFVQDEISLDHEDQDRSVYSTQRTVYKWLRTCAWNSFYITTFYAYQFCVPFLAQQPPPSPSGPGPPHSRGF